MTQAHIQALLMEVKYLKKDLERFMSTTELEKQNLEAHVDLCSERYKGLHDRLSAIEVRLGKMNEDMIAGQKKFIQNNYRNSRHSGRRFTFNSGSNPDEDARLIQTTRCSYR